MRPKVLANTFNLSIWVSEAVQSLEFKYMVCVSSSRPARTVQWYPVFKKQSACMCMYMYTRVIMLMVLLFSGFSLVSGWSSCYFSFQRPWSAASEHQFLPHLINPKVHVIRSQSGLISLVCKNDLTPISTCVLSAEIGQLCEAHLVMWDWVLDSISVYRCQDLDAYLVQNITHGHDCSEPQDPND